MEGLGRLGRFNLGTVWHFCHGKQNAILSQCFCFQKSWGKISRTVPYGPFEDAKRLYAKGHTLHCPKAMGPEDTRCRTVRIHAIPPTPGALKLTKAFSVFLYLREWLQDLYRRGWRVWGGWGRTCALANGKLVRHPWFRSTDVAGDVLTLEGRCRLQQNRVVHGFRLFAVRGRERNGGE